jgi:archaellum biogenesis ATPase FlaH
MGFLSNALKKIDKKGLLNEAAPVIGYPTMLYPFDYRNGYQVNVHDEDGNIIDRWANVGIFSGSFVTITGKTNTAKTAFAVQIAAEICRPYKEAEVYLLDIEGSSNVSRIMQLMNYDYEDVKSKFNYHDEFQYIEDVFEFITEIGNTKLANKDVFATDFSHKNEFGVNRAAYAPTVIILDSLPMIMTRDLEGIEGMASQMYNTRRTLQISQFYKRLRPIMRRANIICLVINHLNFKVDTNPFAKSQAQIMYMKQDEAMPGGNAPLYLAQTVIKMVSCGKYTADKDGFDGFAIRIELIKSKTNRAGTSCVVVYDAEYGFDRYRTMYEFMKENGLIEGRNPYLYIKGFPDIKFSSKNFREECINNFDLFRRALTISAPIMYSYLGNVEDLDQYNESEDEILARMQNLN